MGLVLCNVFNYLLMQVIVTDARLLYNWAFTKSLSVK